jgi:hypothetical protein
MNRRFFLSGFGALVAAPAIVSLASLMPVRGIVMPINRIEGSVSAIEILARWRLDEMYHARMHKSYEHTNALIEWLSGQTWTPVEVSRLSESRALAPQPPA